MKTKSRVVFWGVILAVVLTRFSFGNLLTNPDFETGNYDPWQKHTTAGNQVAIYEATTEQYHNGNYSMKISSDPNGGTVRNYCITQDVTIEPYATYILSGWVYKNDGTSNGVGLIIKAPSVIIGYNAAWPGVSEATYTVTNSNNWQYLEMSTTIAAGVTTAKIHLNTRPAANTTTIVYFDDVSFTKESTPPASITNLSALTGSGGGEVILTWTSPGNDGTNGVLLLGSEYAIKYTSDIAQVDTIFSSTQNPNILISTSGVNPGSLQSYVVGGLVEGATYYFRIWTKDNSGNWSEISNGATAWAMYTTDSVPPDAVSDLETLPITQDEQITLKWTSPGDDGSTGTLTGAYLIQYASQTTIDTVVWSTSNAQVVISTSNVEPDSTQYYTLTLHGGTTYYFRLWSRDEAYNYSTISNGATIYLGIYPPEPITDLTATLWNSTIGAVMLQWTAPSDPPSGAAVSSYIIKYATWNFADTDFDNVRKARAVINPKTPPETEILVLTGLPSDTTVYFHIKSVDSVDNRSPIDTTISTANVYLPPHLIISEFATRTSAGGGEEFVELYNPTDYDIPIGTAPGGMNLKLVRRNTTGGQHNVSLTYLNHTISPKGYFLLATSTNATNGIEPDGKFSGGITDGGTLFITFGSTVTEAIDLVAYGIITEDPYITDYETLATTGSNVSIQRKKIGNSFTDTNDNYYDFAIGSPDPQNTLATAIPKAPSWRQELIEISTGHIKWVIEDRATNEEGLYISSDTNTGARRSENLGPLGGSGGTTSWVEINLTSNTYYTRYAEAYKTTGSSWSAGLTTCTLAYPPEVVTATSVVANTINLSWNYSGATKYLIAYSTTNFTTSWSTAAVILPPATTHQHTGLTGNTTYYYRIYVYNQADVLNQTFFSPTVSTMTYPNSPTGFAITERTTTTITWSWSAPEGGCDGYRLYRATDNSLVADVGNNTTSYTEQNLSTNTVYGRYVRAYNIVGESLSSNPTTVYTLAAVPTNLTVVNVYQSSVTISWNNNTNPEGTRYGVAVAEDVNFTVNHSTKYAFQDNLTATTTTVFSLGGDTIYYFRVWAYNGDGITTGYSNVVSTCTLPGVPAAPSGLYGVALSTTSIKWEWNITSNATYYQIYNADNDSLLANLEGNGTTTWIEINLSSNTKYSRYVKAGNEYGLSGPSSVASRYTHAYAPTVLNAIAVSSSTINLSWNYSGASGYIIRCSSLTGQPNEWYTLAVIPSPSVSYTTTTFIAGNTYYFGIAVYNGDYVVTLWPGPIIVSTRTFPSPVSNFEGVVLSTSSINWQWLSAIGADGYTIYRATDNSIITQLSKNTTYYLEVGLSANTGYGRYIRAFNTTGLGEKSPTATYYTLANPPIELSFYFVGHSSVGIQWSNNNNPNYTRYEVSYSLDNFQTHFSTPIKFSDNWVLTSTSIVNLESNTTYWFRVRACNENNIETMFSNIVSVCTEEIPTKLLRIANPGFELTPELVSWTKEGTVSSILRSSTIKRSGTYSCLFQNPTGLYTGRGIVSSTSSVVGGEKYLVGGWFYVKQEAGTITDTQVRIGIRWIDDNDVVISISTSSDLTLQNFNTWELLTYSAVAPVNASKAVMIIHVKETVNNDNDVYVDDVICEADIFSPGAITDLQAQTGNNPGEIILTWTAPGDDGYLYNNLPSAYYILKYSTYQLVFASSWTWYNQANTYYQNWQVASVGSRQQEIVNNLIPGVTYYFVLRTVDANGNISEFDVNSVVGQQAEACAKEGAIGSIIRINEINCSKSPNWIEFYNASTYTVNITNWEVYEVYESTTAPVKTFGTFFISTGAYLVLYFGSSQTDDPIPYIAPNGDIYYKTYTTNSGLTSTDNGILLKDNNGNLIDAVFYTNSDGSLSYATKFRAGYNYAIDNNQWFGAKATGDNDVQIEKYYTASSKFLKSGMTLARDHNSTDGTNPSKAEWFIHADPTPGGPTEGYVNRVPDKVYPAQIADLVGYSGYNRGTIRLEFTEPGDDGMQNVASLYIVRYSPSEIVTDIDFENAEIRFTNASLVYLLEGDMYEKITVKPSTPGNKKTITLGSLEPGLTYWIAIKTEDEQPNQSLMSNVVSISASASVGSNVRINEIAPREINDWIELYNPTNEHIDLSGWEICNNIEGTDISGEIEAGKDYNVLKVIPDGFILPPNSYAVLNLGYVSPPPDEIGNDINSNGYLDLYAKGSLVDTDGIVFIRDKDKAFVDALVYSDRTGAEPNWTYLWKWLRGHRQWSPGVASSLDAADWSSGDVGKTLGRNKNSDDTDDISYSKNDWYVYTSTKTKGKWNDFDPPSAITTLVAITTSNEGEIQLNWLAPYNDASSLSGNIGYCSPGAYVIVFSTSDTFEYAYSVEIPTVCVALTPQSIVLKGLLPDVSYYFYIRTYDDWKFNLSTFSNIAVGCTYDLPPPQPSDVKVIPSGNSILISWSDVGVPDLDYYELWCDSTPPYDFNDEFIATTTKNTTFLHAWLENYITYYYRVRAADLPPKVLYSEFSNIVFTYPRPSPPFAPSLSYDLTETTTCQIKWVLVTNSVNEDKLYISSAANFSARLWESEGLKSYRGTTWWIETGFTPNQKVTRYAEAWNYLGSSWSDEVYTYTKANQPTGLSVIFAGSNSVGLKWSRNGNPEYTRYEVSYSMDNFQTHFSTPIKFTDNFVNDVVVISNLLPATLYYFRVRAINQIGVETEFSNVVSTTTQAKSGVIIENPDFEKHPLIGWEKIGTASSIISTDTKKNSGRYSCLFIDPTNSFDGRGIRSSTFVVNPDVSYKVGAYFYVQKDSATNVISDSKIQLGIVWLDSNGVIISTSTSAELTLQNFDTWEFLVSTFTTIPQNAYYGKILIRVREMKNYDNDIYVDDVLVDILGIFLPKPEGLIAKRFGDGKRARVEWKPSSVSDVYYLLYRSTTDYDDINLMKLIEITVQCYCTDDTSTLDLGTTYYYALKMVKDEQESELSRCVLPSDNIEPIIEHKGLTLRMLAKKTLYLKVIVKDYLSETGDDQGRIYYLKGKVRTKGKPETTRELVFSPQLSGYPTYYYAEAEIPQELITAEGIEYYLEAYDGIWKTYWPNPNEEVYYKLELPQDKPEQKFITPKNPEVVFGKEVDEVVIRDYNGNEIWRQKSDGVNIIVWRGQDQGGKKLESGAYIYQIKTKDGKRKYGVVIVVK